MNKYIKELINDQDLLFEMIQDFLKYCEENSYPIDELTWEMYYLND